MEVSRRLGPLVGERFLMLSGDRGSLRWVGIVGDWHHLIERIEVNKYGVALVWVRGKKQIFRTPAFRIGHFQIVRYRSLIECLQSGGFWWSDDVVRN